MISMRAYETTTDLLPHQVEAVSKMLPSRVGALFMEMGTGKSRSVIELGKLRAEKIDRAVWFCPVSLKETVKHEILKHTNLEKGDVYIFNDKTDSKSVPHDKAWYIVGIESMSASNRVVFAVHKLVTEHTFCILDESSYIKNHRALRTERITYICQRAKYRMILTGTPLSQGVVDLFSQMKFLSPKILGYTRFGSFEANHLEYSERFPGMIVRAHNTELLAKKMKPYVYQVTKEECLELPGKGYSVKYVSMTPEQRYMYESAKMEILEELDVCGDEWLNSIVIFRLFSVLQSIVCGQWNRTINWKEYIEGRGKKERKTEKINLPHQRLEMLGNILAEVPEKEQVLIWAKYRFSILEIAEFLEESYGKNSYALYYGDLSEKNREKELVKFREESRFLVATQSCGGHGLNLTEASTAVFYSDTFSLAQRLQAEDRIHRIGQTRPVRYIGIYCVDSIDERIQKSLEGKKSVLQSFREEVERARESGKESLKRLVMRL
jgi:SNF2 family DNA or RNA helicase